ncbi:MAG: hypothetical protein PQJ44_06280 [Sphaerochaetaceae bacterium]|nr:hypothetical protein [Sphaerochaetaceae bacterium]
MKNKIIFAVICIIALIFGFNTDVNNLVTFIVKPFSILGGALRNLSLQSGFGNFLAILLFVLISIIPLMILIRMLINKKAKILDCISLIVISLFTFLSIYGYINPTILLDRFDVYNLFTPATENYEMFVFILNSFYVYILYLCIGIYLVLKMHFTENLDILKIFKRIIIVVIAVYIFAIFYVTIPTFINNLSSETTTAVTGLQVIELFNKITIYILLILIFINVEKLIQYMGQADFKEEALSYSRIIYKLCIILLIAILSFQVVNNLYQVVFISSLTDVNASIYVPLDALLISVTFFFLGKYLTKVYDLNEEHNLIV